MARSNAGTKGVPRADREQQIVRAAAEAFGTDGFAATSVSAIAKRAGISKPLVYQYFGSKEGLLGACLHDAGTELTATMTAVASSGVTGLERGLLTLEAIFDLLAPQPWLWRLFFDPSAPQVGDAAQEMAGYTSRVTALAQEGVGELMRLAGVDDPLDIDAMVAVWMSIVDALVGWWLDHPDQTPQQMSQRCVRLFMAALGSPLPPEAGL